MKSNFKLTCILLSLLFSINEKAFANDPCQAILLPPPPDTCAYISGTTVGASASSVQSFPCSGLNGQPDVWYKVIVPACDPDMMVNVLGGSSPGQLQLGILYLYSGSCDRLVLILPCHPFLSPASFASDTVTSLAAGDTLFIRVRETSGNVGAFSLCVFGACPTGITMPAIEQEQQLQLYPNPARNELSVSSKRLSGKCEIEIDNILGQEVLRQESNSHGKPRSIDISSLSPGIYFITLTSEGITESRKFSVEK